MVRRIALILLICAGCHSATPPAAPAHASHAPAAVQAPVVAQTPDASGARGASPIPLPAGASKTLRLTDGPGGVVLSWVGDAGEPWLFAARWSDAGWTAPEVVTRSPGLRATWADAPMVVAGRSHRAAAWLEAAGDQGRHLVLSLERGQGWSEPVRVHTDASETEHGFATVFAQDDGGTQIAWLDGRAYATEDKVTALLRRTLGPDGVLGGEVVVDPRTCDCCPTAGATLRDGTPLLAWRDRIGREVRDLSAARLDGAAPARVHEDGWEFAGCPVNGPGLAPLDGGAVVAWFTEGQGPAVRVAFTADGGSWTGAQDAAAGPTVKGKTAALALGHDAALVIWVEQRDDGGRIVGRVARGGALGPAHLLGSTDAGRGAGFPSMARLGDQVLIVSAGSGHLVAIDALLAGE